MSKINKIKITLAVLSILLLTVGIGIYWWSDSKQVKWINSNTPIITAVPTHEELTIWETYQNQKYGYEIKYPKDFSIEEISEMVQLIYHAAKNISIIDITILMEESKSGEYIPVRRSDLHSFISFVDDLVEKLSSFSFKDEGEYSKQLIKFNGYDALLVKNERIKEDWFFVFHNQLVFRIRRSFTFPEYEHDISKILSTFKFFR